jgi:hypothetical protein
LMVDNATFKNISVISWRSVLLVEKQDDQEKTTDLYTSARSRFELTTSVVIGSDCIGSCKSNYHTIKITTAPQICNFWKKRNHFPIGCHFETLSAWISYLHSFYSLQRTIKLRYSLALFNLAAFEQNYFRSSQMVLD